MDRFDAMALLIEVADAGSLSAAGRRLGLPLSTVSRRVADLEARLHVRLINRSTRRLSLTSAGEDYLAACRRIVDEVHEAERVAGGEYAVPRGMLTIAAPLVFGRLHVLPVVADFIKSYPEIRVRLLFGDGMVDLIGDHVDVAVRIAHLADSALVALRVGTIQPVVCASPDYLARHGTPRTLDDLARHDIVAFDGMTPSGCWPFHRDGGEVMVRVGLRLSVNTAEAAVDAAVAGLGIARLLSYQAEEARRRKQLIRILRDFEPPPWPIYLMHAGQPRIALKVRACLEFLRPRLKARLSAFGEP